MARSRLPALASLLLVLPLAACPLDLPFPLGEPGSGSLDPALEGRWGWADPKNGGEGEFGFYRFSASEYVALGREKGKEPVLLFRVFTTKVGPASYLNVCELKPGKEPSFLYARYAVKGDELSLRLLDDREVPGEAQGDPTTLSRYLAGHPELPATDGQPLVLRRLPDEARKPAPAAVPKGG